MAKLSLRWAILAYLMSFALVLVVWIGLLQGGRMPLLLRDPWATYICVAIITILGALGLGLIVSQMCIRDRRRTGRLAGRPGGRRTGRHAGRLGRYRLEGLY